ncbi:hypothetical protein PVT67_14335 [Gallaecimonas kandeliae]|uniref:hypothetical protein n=1 Tax=Gallaecimonas kandeliae TaxID=3029055 RepID=UPI0026486E38|nr:hypothetical protein [Gallaecimonas kandeliae]WKE64833.1 hypothetical protein PVT67_14335 [Gallaecimonas kandeliae]
MNWLDLTPLLAWPAALLLPALPFWRAWNGLADGLAAKVNRGEPRQRRLSGLLALLLLWGALLLICALLALSAELPQVIEGLGFYLALSDGRLAKLQALENLGKVQGRQLLGTVLKRDCGELSEEGLYKGAIEGRWRLARERLLLLLLFALGTGLVALLLRAWWQLADRWHPARPGCQAFGRAAWAPASLLRCPGTPLATFWLVLPLKASALFTKEKPRGLAMLAQALGCQLGGPLRIQGRRFDRPRVGPAPPPTQLQLGRLRRLMQGGELGTLLLAGCWLAL